MFLRSLTLKGFKSFADKTTLEFAPGVSVIIGPNGSGKSNLVDAISWVLGEQGVRSLRGGQMTDVIFAGSPNRPALGLAEIQLVIDNEAGKIPVPLSELSISRAVYRSGDSEYRIGGEQRRLMDIQELLSDSGIGRALHTIVGQGQLDEVLTARPEDRRQFIEEAAGIAKHRRRKDRAQRKLASLDQDLLRLQDVLTELRRQLRPLRQQAEMASKHEKLTTEAEDLAWRLEAARLKGLHAAHAVKKPAWEEGLGKRTAAKQRLEDLDARIDAIGGVREAAVAALAVAEQAARQTQETRSLADGALQMAKDAEAAARARLAGQSERSAKIEALKGDIDRAEADYRRLGEELVQREADYDAAEAAFREAERLRREAEEERRRLSEEAAAHRAEIETVRRSLASYEHERERLEESLAEAREKIRVAQAGHDQLERTVETLEGRATPLRAQQESLREEHDRLVGQTKELEDALQRHRTRRDVLEARKQDLAETPGSRFLSAHEGRASGLLRHLVRAERQWEKALLAALGPYADAVVYESRSNALADAHDGQGAVIAAPAPDRALAPTLTNERHITTVLRIDRAADPILATLLREVYLTDSMSEAEDKHRDHPAAAFVTPDGVLVGPMAIHTASEDMARARVFADELEQVERELAGAESALRPVRRRTDDLEGETADAAAQLADVLQQAGALQGQMSATSSELVAAQKEEELHGIRLGGLESSAAAWRETLATAEAQSPLTELPPLPDVPVAPVDARVALEGVRRDRLAIQARLDVLRTEREHLMQETPDQLRAEAERAEAARTQSEEELAAALLAATEAAGARETAYAGERQATEDEARTNKEWREAAAELDHLRESYEQEDRARGELERRIADAERLLKEGHGREPAEALAALKDDDTLQQLEKRSELVQRRLGLLGKVNLLASGEFEQLEERHDFMARELDDVKKARRDLLDVVRQVDEEVIRLFDEAFRDVAAAFEMMFQELFPGGEGRLILTDPANLLETGVEVEARPGRKRVKRLSLLSGGERALTALGFLFSIFKARPSPFYLLDEVEAALDDVNLHRFLGLIKGFAKTSQVIIVTHQKRTMEIAEMMYGVSMNQDGATRVVCQKLDDPGAKAPDSPALMVSEPEPVN